jgi:hypothetical protein
MFEKHKLKNIQLIFSFEISFPYFVMLFFFLKNTEKTIFRYIYIKAFFFSMNKLLMNKLESSSFWPIHQKLFWLLLADCLLVSYIRFCYFLICCNCILFVVFCLYLLILFTLFHLFLTIKIFNEIVTTFGK